MFSFVALVRDYTGTSRKNKGRLFYVKCYSLNLFRRSVYYKMPCGIKKGGGGGGGDSTVFSFSIDFVSNIPE